MRPQSPGASDTFAFRTWKPVWKTVPRLGLSAHFGLGPDLVEKAVEEGIRFFYWGFPRALSRAAFQPIRDFRNESILATGSTLDKLVSPAHSVECCLHRLGLDYLDVFLLVWVRSERRMQQFEKLLRLREQGKVKMVGASCHDLGLAASLVENFPLDVLMVRYNAAWREAETALFAQLPRTRPAIIAFTATRWGQLLNRPSEWPREERVPTGADCYRFVLTNPAVDLALMRPKTIKQLEENIALLGQGPMLGERVAWMRRFGDHLERKKRSRRDKSQQEI